jgi:hypothetical protein
VLTSLIQGARRATYDTLKLACAGMVIGLLAAVAVFFITRAAFVWAEGEYGAVAAGLGLGVFFLALAVAIFVTVRFRRRSLSRQKDLRCQELQQTLLDAHDPVAMAAGIEILRLVGARKIIPALALSAVILAALQSVPRTKSRAERQK